MARAQRLADATIYPLLAGGCHCARDTVAAIENSGFEIERQQRIAFKPSLLLPTIPHILGAAWRAKLSAAQHQEPWIPIPIPLGG